MKYDAKEFKQYPEIMNKEQMRIACHISKRTALYLLQFDLIPHTCTGKKTRCYSIKKSDVIAFMNDREVNPEKYIAPENWYKYGSVDVKAYKIRIQPQLPDDAKKIRRYYESKLSSQPDVMGVSKVVSFTGYNRRTVSQWIRLGKLRALVLPQKYMVPKCYLIDWLCSDEYNSTNRKSREHINIMIAGHLQIKNDSYYMVLNYRDSDGKRKQPWIPTGLPVKGNKKRAEKMLMDMRKSFVPPVNNENENLSADMLFADYMETWLEIIRGSVEKTTFSSYTQMVKKKIAPYFRDTGLTLGGIQAKHIQSFYLHELKSVSASTVIHEHANIHKALKYAVKMDLIPFNPADKVERPKKQKYIADYYRLDELEKLFEVTKDHPYSLLIQMTAFYGLRRSEALGLKWDAIDFERNTITIRHIVTEAEVDGKSVIISEDRAKTKSSLRSLPLVGHFREKLLELKEQQKENKRVCGNCYNCEYDGYIFVDAMGTIFNPNAVTENFSKILKRNDLRHIRFHDLRHSCASLLLANDVPMKQIQEWLGHSDISTTANIYSHLDYKSKITSANVMDNILVLPDSKSPGW